MHRVATDAISVKQPKQPDRIWERAAWTQWFVDIEGDAKPAPRFRTRAKMLFDDQYFHFLAFIQEPHVWATLTEKNSVIYASDNDFEVKLSAACTPS